MNFDISRFWSKVDIKSKDECWEWTGGKSLNGYGAYKVSGKQYSAHRVSWIISNGQIPVVPGYHGLCVLHKCDNRSCVNPDHLFLGTVKDNSEDCRIKGRTAKPVGEKHPMAKLNRTQVAVIRLLATTGKFTHTTIASAFGITRSNVSYIVNNKSWSID